MSSAQRWFRCSPATGALAIELSFQFRFRFAFDDDGPPIRSSFVKARRALEA